MTKAPRTNDTLSARPFVLADRTSPPRAALPGCWPSLAALVTSDLSLGRTTREIGASPFSLHRRSGCVDEAVASTYCWPEARRAIALWLSGDSTGSGRCSPERRAGAPPPDIPRRRAPLKEARANSLLRRPVTAPLGGPMIVRVPKYKWVHDTENPGTMISGSHRRPGTTVRRSSYRLRGVLHVRLGPGIAYTETHHSPTH